LAGLLTTRERRWLLRLVIAVIAVRLVTLGAYPLMDSTESRYGEIARKMLETGQWLVPQFDYGVPFWGKPPLSMWLSAVAMALLGVNEFAARLPSLLSMIACGALVYALAVLRGGRDQALWTLAVFAPTGLVFVAAGGTMTDPALVLGMTLSMAGFWIALYGAEAHRRAAGLAFFAGLVIGLLAKGPLTLVLVFGPLVGFTLWTRLWRVAWQRIPWIGGSIVAFAAAGTWYWSAERASPGFLEYFLIGEHWKRFLETGWAGDLYGAAHSHPRGLIWLLWIAAALPWSVGTLAAIGRSVVVRPRGRLRGLAADPWIVYLTLWAVTPMLFFTLAVNVLIVYVLPGLPAYALLVGDLWRPDAGSAASSSDGSVLRPAVRRALVAGAAVPVLFAGVIIAMHTQFETERSHKALVRDYMRARPDARSRLVYFPDRPPSAEFYSRGTARTAPEAAALAPYLDDATTDFFAMREKDFGALPEATGTRLRSEGVYGGYRLLRETAR
jgi:4-amino-4-deoxy-L-arabinose transferase-like glycosyltransferase